VKINDLACFLDKKSEDSVNIAKMLELQSKLIGCDENFAKAGRKFVKEGPVVVFEKKKWKKKRHVLLFNDLLVLTGKEKKK